MAIPTRPGSPSIVTAIGTPPWTFDDMRAHLREFSELYARRPVRDNAGGMSSAHLFLMWYVLRFLRPPVVVESGVWRGQGTWFIEQALPEASIYSIDISWRNLRYRSPRAVYLTGDFTTHDWSHLPKHETLLFFDDHVNAVERVKRIHHLGFRHAMFEDNYAPRVGNDVYSLKMAFMHAGLRVSHHWRAVAGRLLGTRSDRPVRPNADDARALRELIEVYQELPPVFAREVTRWGDPWNDPRNPTTEPLLTHVEESWQQLFFDEAPWYTWLCYVRLRDQPPSVVSPVAISAS